MECGKSNLKQQNKSKKKIKGYEYICKALYLKKKKTNFCSWND